MESRHTKYDLKQMQSLPLEAKIEMTKRRIREWYDHYDGMVYVSFSGGKDSTVLKHIVDSMYDDVPAVFVNTGLEYPEIQKFVHEIKEGKYGCFNSDVVIVRPEMMFADVIQKYGYPVIGKRVAHYIEYYRKGSQWAINMMNGNNGKTGEPCGYSQERYGKWKFVAESDFKVSDKCCDIMKKKPLHAYKKQTKRKPILGSMAYESKQREDGWIKTGCNAFDSKDPISKPLSFWG